jgi:uncharacterized membrane protein YfcA
MCCTTPEDRSNDGRALTLRRTTMEFILIPLVALIVSGLTLFSGFGLGTVLLPVFAVFFPVELAVALTAVVHFLNNLFKLALLGRHVDRGAIVRFGIPAVLMALVGARLLLWLSGLEPLASYSLGTREMVVTPVKLTVAVLMVGFAILELAPRFSRMSFDAKYLPVGGALSGFFGGLSGHQGALRSAFLLHSGLTKESFIATGVVIAAFVDAGRLTVYGAHFARAGLGENILLLAVTTLCAFGGALVGNRLLKKVTLRSIQVIIGTMLIVLAAALGAGLI